MVRQPYIQRLALGRSAFISRQQAGNDQDGEEEAQDEGQATSSAYSQRYTARGHPENAASRAASRSLRRAQNDVLSTVGVCVYVDESGRVMANAEDNSAVSQVKRREMDLILKENETGLWLRVFEDLFCPVATTFIANVRKLLQTYNFYIGAALNTIMRARFAQRGPAAFILAGEFSSAVFYILDTLCDPGIDYVRDLFMSWVVRKQPFGRLHDKTVRRLAEVADTSLKMASQILLMPLQQYATLQRLGLLPWWPLLPTYSQYVGARLLLPLAAQTQYANPWVSHAINLATSPLATFFYMLWFTQAIKYKLLAYCRAALPRPDHPDELSLSLELDGAPLTIWSQQYPKVQLTLGEEIESDLDYLRENARISWAKIRLFLRSLYKRPNSPPIFPGGDNEIECDGPPAPDAERSGVSTQMAANQSDVIPSIERDATTAPSAAAAASEASSDSSGQTDPLAPPSNIQIRTRSGSTSTLHMDVEINATRPGPEPYTSSFVASSRRAETHSYAYGGHHDAYHHVTALTLHPADSLSSLIASALTTIVRLPVEGLFLRSVAHSFIASCAPEAYKTWIRDELFPIVPWSGPTHSWRSLFGHTQKLWLCIGLESMVNLALWRVGHVVALWAGTRWFSWGRF